MMETRVLSTGKATFKLQVPYRLVQAGPAEPGAPVVVWLHGFGQSAAWMQERFQPVWEQLTGFHLFVQAPYLLLERYVQQQKEGFSWYLFNGDRDVYATSTEHAAEFVFDLISRLRPVTGNGPLHVCGWSQGAYLAGYMGIHRPHLVRGVWMLGGRFKDELVADWTLLRHLTLVALHGDKDEEVKPQPQRESMARAAAAGIDAVYEEVQGTHTVNESMTARLSGLMAPYF